MEERVLEGHVKDLTYLEPRRLAFENTSASAKRVVLLVTPDLRDEIIRQLREEIVELRSVQRSLKGKEPPLPIFPMSLFVRAKFCTLSTRHLSF
ncbi:hypothetical protein RJT34_33120 [Clitoria ternatea]|uniref:Uncharacterized protein n=1 Tax=Clitoria ternatea TaxID=43366 RepID=A0AAN9F1G2_CLITE